MRMAMTPSRSSSSDCAPFGSIRNRPSKNAACFTQRSTTSPDPTLVTRYAGVAGVLAVLLLSVAFAAQNGAQRVTLRLGFATLYQIPTDVRLNHRMDVTSGVLAEECAQLLRGFFEALRGVGPR